MERRAVGEEAVSFGRIVIVFFDQSLPTTVHGFVGWFVVCVLCVLLVLSMVATATAAAPLLECL